MRFVFFLALTCCAACSNSPASGGDAGVACVTGLSPTCKPLYDPPIYQTIFDKTFHPTCATGSGSCHTSDFAAGGLVFENADDAYSMLMQQSKMYGEARVVPGDAGCSLIVEKIESSDPSFRMPRGTIPLSAPEKCAIELWIANGAKR